MSIAINHYAASVQGDREAFGEIVRQYQNLVSAVTYSITGNRQESEDLAQETFLTAWRTLSELREVEKLPAWLCGIARNLANNWIRRTQLERQNRCESALEQIPAAESTDESDIAESEREERIALLWATLKEIPLQFREPLVMYYQQNQSVVDIASALEISEANVRQRIARGRKYLKAEVERQVEKTLAHIRPSEHFTVAVLAALPIALTGEQVLAAGAAGAAAAQSASSGGAGAGASLAAGIMAFIGAFIGAVLWLIVVVLGFVLGIWSGIRNAPTLRARQWMLKVTLGYVIAGSLFFTLLHLTYLGIIYAEFDRFAPGRNLLHNICCYIYGFLIFFIPVFVIASSYLANRRWRQIVEEEMVGNRPPGGCKESEPQSEDCAGVARPSGHGSDWLPSGGRQPTFLHSMYLWVGIALFSALFASAVQTVFEVAQFRFRVGIVVWSQVATI